MLLEVGSSGRETQCIDAVNTLNQPYPNEVYMNGIDYLYSQKQGLAIIILQEIAK